MDEQKKEIIYILTNEAMPGYVKVGRTTDLEQRIRSLDNTSCPLPFECFYACTVQDAQFAERQLHEAFGDNRVRSSREFFEISPERCVAALKLAAIEDVTPREEIVESEEDEKALLKARTRKERFNFKMVNVVPGTVLQFARDENVTCVVKDSRNVEFEGEELSLSEAALRALRDAGYNWKSAQGAAYWLLEGETLSDRRTRMEESE